MSSRTASLLCVLFAPCACVLHLHLSQGPDWNFRFFFYAFSLLVFYFINLCLKCQSIHLFFLIISIYKSPCFVMGLTMQAHGNCCKHCTPVMIIHTRRLALDADSCFSYRQLFHHTTFLQRKRLYGYNLSWPNTVYQSTDIMHSRSQTEWSGGYRICLSFSDFTRCWSCMRLQDSGWPLVLSWLLWRSFTFGLGEDDAARLALTGRNKLSEPNMTSVLSIHMERFLECSCVYMHVHLCEHKTFSCQQRHHNVAEWD